MGRYAGCSAWRCAWYSAWHRSAVILLPTDPPLANRPSSSRRIPFSRPTLIVTVATPEPARDDRDAGPSSHAVGPDATVARTAGACAAGSGNTAVCATGAWADAIAVDVVRTAAVVIDVAGRVATGVSTHASGYHTAGMRAWTGTDAIMANAVLAEAIMADAAAT